MSEAGAARAVSQAGATGVMGAVGDAYRADTRELSLAIGGMTCGACAARIERRLNRLDGVQASVNFASEQALVTLDGSLELERILAEVQATGYSATPLAQDPREDHGEQARELDARVRSLRRRFVVAAILFMPLCDLSILLSLDSSLRLAGWRWLMIALAAPVVTWAAWPFYEAAVRNARHAATTMDTLVSAGIVAATAWSLYTMFVLYSSRHGATAGGLGARSGGGLYLDVPAGVATFLLAGRYFEAWSRRRSGNALRALAAVGARDVAVLDEHGDERRVPLSRLRVGERFVVRPGETIATDGEVVDGRAAVDRSVMTGESLPEETATGDRVLGGTVALDGRLVVRATSVGGDTQLGQMLRLVARAQSEKASVQRLADRVSSFFVPTVMLISAATLAVWLLGGHAADPSISAALAVLIVACPCALGLATPAALVVATWAGARLGIFFKGYGALEASRAIDTVVLDKTGTVTEGRMVLAGIQAAPDCQEERLLALAAAVEAASEHPLAQAVVAAALARGLEVPAVSDFVAVPGSGAHGLVDGAEITVGRPGEGLPAELVACVERWERQGRTAVAVRESERVLGVLALADAIRSSAAEAVAQLHALGLRCVLATGDNDATAQAVAAAIGVDEVLSEALPADKVALIRSLQQEGRRVAMVGDGVNDAAALASADLGLAIGSGTDVAINAADLVILRDDLRVAPTAIRLARRTLRTIHGNLAWAFAYNLIAIPVAALGLLNPLFAGAAMALSSTLVVFNSARLRRTVAAASVPAASVPAASVPVRESGRVPVEAPAVAGRVAPAPNAQLALASSPGPAGEARDASEDSRPGRAIRA